MVHNTAKVMCNENEVRIYFKLRVHTEGKLIRKLIPVYRRPSVPTSGFSAILFKAEKLLLASKKE